MCCSSIWSSFSSIPAVNFTFMISGNACTNLSVTIDAEHRREKPTILLLDVFAILNRLDDARIRARPADAERSSSFTSDASVKRGGGCVKCCVGVSSIG